MCLGQGLAKSFLGMVLIVLVSVAKGLRVLGSPPKRTLLPCPVGDWDWRAIL